MYTATQRGSCAYLFGWKERPFTLLDLVSNFVNCGQHMVV